MSLFKQITENAYYHNQNNYDALDKIQKHLNEGWNWCENKGSWEGYDSENENKIPDSFIKDWCLNADFKADGLQEYVEVLCS